MITKKSIQDKDIILLLVMTLLTNALIVKGEYSASKPRSDFVEGMGRLQLRYLPWTTNDYDL